MSQTLIKVLSSPATEVVVRWTVVAFALVRVGEFDIRVDAEHLQKTVQVFGIGNFTVWALWFTFAVGVRYWAKIPFEWRLAIIEVALCVIFQAAFALWLLRFFAASEVSGIGVVFKAVFTGFVVIVGAIGGAISGIFYCGAWALASVALKRRRQVVEEEEQGGLSLKAPFEAAMGPISEN